MAGVISWYRMPGGSLIRRLATWRTSLLIINGDGISIRLLKSRAAVGIVMAISNDRCVPLAPHVVTTGDYRAHIIRLSRGALRNAPISLSLRYVPFCTLQACGEESRRKPKRKRRKEKPASPKEKKTLNGAQNRQVNNARIGT